MHWWNLIKSACLCSQSDFECHAGWSGHNAYIRVALVEDDLNGHTALALEQDYPSRGNHPLECWHSGMVEDRRKQHEHQKYCFNRSLGYKEERRKEEEQVKHQRLIAGGTGGAWRPSGLHTQESNAEPTLISPTRALDLCWSIRSWTVATDLHIIHNLPALWIYYFYWEWTDCELSVCICELLVCVSACVNVCVCACVRVI